MFTADSEDSRRTAIYNWESLSTSDKAIHKMAVKDNSVYVNSLRYKLEIDDAKGKDFRS